MVTSILLTMSDAETGEEVVSMLDTPEMTRVASGQYWRPGLLADLRTCRRRTNNEVRRRAITNAIETIAESDSETLLVQRVHASAFTMPTRT